MVTRACGRLRARHAVRMRSGRACVVVRRGDSTVRRWWHKRSVLTAIPSVDSEAQTKTASRKARRFFAAQPPYFLAAAFFAAFFAGAFLATSFFTLATTDFPTPFFAAAFLAGAFSSEERPVGAEGVRRG